MVDLVRYVFIDAVGFTQGRSVEAQASVIAALNRTVKDSVVGVTADRLIFVPTGDGICICLIGRSDYDAHVQLALVILERLARDNAAEGDATRRFEVRIGIAENSDNIITDINGNANVAGSGVNLAARIMDVADGGQILVSVGVYEVLSRREKYMNSFKGYSTKTKHGEDITVYQLTLDSPGLSTTTPRQLRPPPPRARHVLTEFEAYYLGIGLQNREFFKRHVGYGISDYAATVLLAFMADDAVGTQHETDVYPYSPRVEWKTLDEAFEVYASCAFWVVCDLASFIYSERLSRISDLLESRKCQFPKPEARERILADQPAIATRLGISAS